MKFYLVGGAVRDKRLGIEPKDRDWVVVGGTPTEMLNNGFEQVGADFPVFLHPETREEYALARIEKKTGNGYNGFRTSTENVTLTEDLYRRDLTINAMAETPEGELVDPFNGLADLKASILRHVSSAFAEDPLRVLRVARFAARYAQRGFTVHSSTMVLMKRMVERGELDHLTPERVWKETEKALSGSDPQVYFSILHNCGALRILFPELDALFGIPQPAEHHPEIDVGIHSLMTLKQASVFTCQDPVVCFAALVHDLGKALSPKNNLPHHYGHEANGVYPVNTLCDRLKVPAVYRELAVMSARYHLHSHRAMELRPTKIMELFEKTDAFRRTDRFHSFLDVCRADAQGRLGFQERPYPQAAYLTFALTKAQGVNVQDLIKKGFTGEKLGRMIRQARVAAIKNHKESWTFLS